MAKTIAGLYNSFEDAREVRDALVNAGFSRSDISILAANSEDRYKEFVDRAIDESEYDKYYVSADDERSHAAEGAVAGGLIGGAGAAMLAVFIPGIGPFTATGWLLAGLVGLAGGAITGGILGALVDAGIDQDDATVYSEGVRRGYSLVTVRADDNDATRIATIMSKHGAIDTDERADYWTSKGWERDYDASEPVYNLQQIEAERTGYQRYIAEPDANEIVSSANNNNDEQIYYQFGRQLGTRSNGSVSSWEMAEADVRRDWESRYGDDDSTWEDVKDRVRSGWESVKEAFAGDDDFYRQHYMNTYQMGNRGYNYYAPHYHYGYKVATSPAYTNGNDWTIVEPQLRQDWEREYRDQDTTWDDVKAAVRSGWESVKQKVR